MRVMTIGACNLPFPERHVGGAHELGFSLQMALSANLDLRLLVEERCLVVHLSQLESVAGLLHESMAIHAGNAPTGMGACPPVGLNASLMTLQTGFVLTLRRFSRVFAKRHETPDPSTAASGNVVASRPVATFTGPLFRFVARIEKEDLSHHRLGKFLNLRTVTGLTNFVADISGLLRRRCFR